MTRGQNRPEGYRHRMQNGRFKIVENGVWVLETRQLGARKLQRPLTAQERVRVRSGAVHGELTVDDIEVYEPDPNKRVGATVTGLTRFRRKQKCSRRSTSSRN